MAKEITAYQSHDGQLHLRREDAEFSEFSSDMRTDIGDFLKQRGCAAVDHPTLARLLCDWELWKQGGANAWRGAQTEHPRSFDAFMRRQREAEAASRQMTLPLPATPQPPIKLPKRSAGLQRVLVLGLPAAQHARILRDFGGAFELALHDKTDPPPFSALKTCERVFVMLQFISFEVREQLAAKGIKAESIFNDVDELDNRLTEFYVQSHK